MINILEVPDKDGNPSVGVVIGTGPEDFFTTLEGVRHPGVALSPARAVEVVRRIILVLASIEATAAARVQAAPGPKPC